MTIQLHAQPYDISANGFYFESAEEFHYKAMNNRNKQGDIVEEYEVQFIDGTKLDSDLAKAFGLYQSNIGQYFKAVREWREYQKFTYIIAVGECGYDFDLGSDDVDDLDVDIYEARNLLELAEQFVDDGLYGEIPECLKYYIDYNAIASDLAIDHSEIRIGGVPLVYRCS